MTQTLFVQAEDLKNQIGGTQGSASLNLGAVGKLVKEDPTKDGAATLQAQTTTLKDQIGGGKTSATKNLAATGTLITQDPTQTGAPSLHTQASTLKTQIGGGQASATQNLSAAGLIVEYDPTQTGLPSLHAQLLAVQNHLYPDAGLAPAVKLVGTVLRGHPESFPQNVSQQAIDLRDRIGDFSDFVLDLPEPDVVKPSNRFYNEHSPYPPIGATYFWAGDFDEETPNVWPGQDPSQDTPWPFQQSLGENTLSSYINISKFLLLIEDKFQNGWTYQGTPGEFSTTLRDFFEKIKEAP